MWKLRCSRDANQRMNANSLIANDADAGLKSSQFVDCAY